jgi:hypothetical protein
VQPRVPERGQDQRVGGAAERERASAHSSVETICEAAAD